MGIRQWKLPDVDPEAVQGLIRHTGLPRIVCAFLAARGHLEAGEAAAFVGENDLLDDPYTIADMDKAVERIREAVGDGERIAVYGDYDCDGITATALLVSYFQAVGADVIYYIPAREKEGYGLNNQAIEILRDQRVDLIVTVDNGISAHGEIAYAAELGIDVVVTDHHTPRETLPAAVAVVNPHRADCPSRFKELAGVGVAFKLICALEDAQGDELLEHYSDIVTLGTIADVVPLTGENRTIVRHGLSRLAETDNPGIAALIDVSGLRDRALTSESVAFGLIPRINAAGRVGVADDVVELLLTDDPGFAAEAAEAVNEQNAQRKKIEEGMLQEIEGILSRNPQILNRRVLVVSGEGWHHGVVGIVASKLMERFEKPCLLFSIENGEARGSGRSIKGFSLIEAITACSANLTRYGGHTLAAGLTLPSEHLEAFENSLQEYARATCPVMPLPELAADCTLAPGELTVENVGVLSVLEPFGAGNEAPLFHLQDLVIEGIYPTNDKKHIRIRLAGGGNSFYAIYFGMSDTAFPYKTGQKTDIMAKISVGEYNGKAQLSVKIADLRPAGVPQDQVALGREQYACHLRGENGPEENGAIIPTREDIGLVYKFLKRCGNFTYGVDELYIQLMGTGIAYCKLVLALDVLEEMGFVTRENRGGTDTFSVVAGAPRADLADSAILRQLKA